VDGGEPFSPRGGRVQIMLPARDGEDGEAPPAEPSKPRLQRQVTGGGTLQRTCTEASTGRIQLPIVGLARAKTEEPVSPSASNTGSSSRGIHRQMDQLTADMFSMDAYGHTATRSQPQKLPRQLSRVIEPASPKIRSLKRTFSHVDTHNNYGTISSQMDQLTAEIFHTNVVHDGLQRQGTNTSNSNASLNGVEIDADPVRQYDAKAKKEKERMQLEIRHHLERELGVSSKVSFGLKEDLSTRDDFIGRNRYRVHQILQLNAFDAAIGVVIVMNSLTIGLESSLSLNPANDLSIFEFLEKIYMAVYCVELGLRFFAYKLTCLANPWVQFDAFLVAISFVSLAYESIGGGNLGPLNIVKVLRLSRLVRALRLVVQFRMLWTLIRGLYNTIEVMAHTVFLVVLLLYLFACVGVELITKDPDGLPVDIVERNFSDVGPIMLSLLQFVILDGTHGIYFDMVIARPSLICYFIPIIFILGLALMNLFTAVVIEGVFAQAKVDAEVGEAYKKQLAKSNLPRLHDLFYRLDLDGSGDITLDELHNAPAETLEELSKFVNLEDLDQLHSILDQNNDGKLSWEEFFQGICKIVSSHQSIESIGATKHFERQNQAIAELTRKVEAIPLIHRDRSRALSDPDLQWNSSTNLVKVPTGSSLYVPV
jgi:voltage-gated sodium channel